MMLADILRSLSEYEQSPVNRYGQLYEVAIGYGDGCSYVTNGRRDDPALHGVLLYALQVARLGEDEMKDALMGEISRWLGETNGV